MDTNPYKPPQAPLEPESGPGSANTIWWKSYFWLTVVFAVLGLVGMSSLESSTVFDYIDFVISLTAVVGTYGFAYYKRVGNMVFWRYFFYVALLESVFFSAVLPAMGVKRYGEAPTFGALYLFEIAYAILLLTAIYQYAYRRPFIWTRPGDD